MNFDLTEDQALLKATVERFGAEHHGGDVEKRRRQRSSPAGFDRASWAALADLGVLALPFAEADGGLGGGAVELIATAEALGQALTVEPVTECLVPAARLLSAAAAPQRATLVEPIISGATVPALAVTETGGRYNMAHVETRARAQGDGWRLSGAKSAVWQGIAADLFLVSARVEGASRAPDGIGLFVVAASDPGVERRSWCAIDGQLAAELTFTDAPAQRLDGLGLAALEDAVTAAWLAASAEMLGLTQYLFDATLAYVKTRSQFGQPIGRFQVIQHRLTDAYIKLELARSMLYRAALADEATRPRTVAGAKAFISEAALFIGHEAVQLHGGMGVTDELSVGHALKRVQFLARLFGDRDVAAEAYARAA